LLYIIGLKLDIAIFKSYNIYLILLKTFFYILYLKAIKAFLFTFILSLFSFIFLLIFFKYFNRVSVVFNKDLKGSILFIHDIDDLFNRFFKNAYIKDNSNNLFFRLLGLFTNNFKKHKTLNRYSKYMI
jgi:hypothetical protein